jgi:hypothetical protein
MSQYLRDRKPRIRAGGRINLKRIFPGAVRQSMLDVHLYFVKLLGCRIMDSGIPIGIKPFSAALKNRTPHQDVHVAIGPMLEEFPHALAGMTEVHGDTVAGVCVFATCFYHVGALSVNVLYAIPSEKAGRITSGVAPNTIGHHMEIAKFG